MGKFLKVNKKATSFSVWAAALLVYWWHQNNNAVTSIILEVKPDSQLMI